MAESYQTEMSVKVPAPPRLVVVAKPANRASSSVVNSDP